MGCCAMASAVGSRLATYPRQANQSLQQDLLKLSGEKGSLIFGGFLALELKVKSVPKKEANTEKSRANQEAHSEQHHLNSYIH